jgi:stearoyl-CoA desaturase (delta-9 desaturase)
MAEASVGGPENVSLVSLEEDRECHVGTGHGPPFDPIGLPATVDRGRIIWPYLGFVLAFHLLLPLAFVPYFFSWTGLLLVPLGNYVFCSLGIGAGYHRLLTHRSFRCPRWLEHTFALLGVCSLQDSPARWVMIHRMHHQNSDRQPDPHSPLVNFFWGHMGWLFVENKQLSLLSTYERYARDILRDRFYMRLERGRLWVWVYVVHAVLFYLVGLAVGWLTTGEWQGGVQFGLSLLLWGVIFRTIYSWHVTWGVNSAAHYWGYRNYETDENSRNNWLFALATNGDGWHNNHHADPRCCAHGFHRWWELDVTYLTIRLLKLVGLVTDVVPVRVRMAGAEPTTNQASGGRQSPESAHSSVPSGG